MSHATPLLPARQVANTARQLQNAEGLPFAHHLPKEDIHNALRQVGAPFRDRLFSPAVTLWAFLSQVLDRDHSCRQVMMRLFAWLNARGIRLRSTDTGAYCKARARLPEDALRLLTRQTGQRPLADAPDHWLWKNRVVKLVDGTCLSMPDTQANQKEYPQPKGQKPGVGFPQMRLLVILSLAVGTVLDAAFGPSRGPRTGESALFRSRADALEDDDVLLADRGFCSYFVLAATRARGADAVVRLNGRRRALLSLAGQRLGPGDTLVHWRRPKRPDWLSVEEYESIAEMLTLRIIWVHVATPGYRTKVLQVATTLLDPSEVSSRDIADLYLARWHAELDLRSIKQALQMDVLRGQSPELVRKEVWVHLLAYNVVRGLMVQAARQAGVRPRELSFTGALQALNAFLPYLGMASDEAEWLRLWGELVRVVGQQRVGNRPGRCEPRVKKRRPKNWHRLNEPRADARARLMTKT
jgi:Transposase DDE domain/Insertion element 4 transposase N-terminal